MDDRLVDGWFEPFLIGPMFGKEDKYGIVDKHYNNPHEAIMRNFQKGKKTKNIWKGTLEQAIDMCSLLNRDANVREKATAKPTSDTQARYYSNRPKHKTPPSMRAFKKCACGAMYKGEKHC